ncbi:Oidioi.mRNA.OKI2018_I69.chr2.g4705.t1.cds [Oikopleura dioica]|uniref:Oidioi.mRNA.OKI2018_I69.chr2.g4705.t1.cds n=1 Tax=Oikopleura dioica TaxID=34765 RepID=A0ABN7SYL1_OIKDI|nr:Oidioi.mRNA.OKI2018_I69.chr2.g4705.t1.cds [Oikopleura dioica]
MSDSKLPTMHQWLENVLQADRSNFGGEEFAIEMFDKPLEERVGDDREKLEYFKRKTAPIREALVKCGDGTDESFRNLVAVMMRASGPMDENVRAFYERKIAAREALGESNQSRFKQYQAKKKMEEEKENQVPIKFDWVPQTFEERLWQMIKY